jgi:hypothetical protein
VHAVGGGEALNSYHYVAGNLLAARDPLGLMLVFADASVERTITTTANGRQLHEHRVTSREVHTRANDSDVRRDARAEVMARMRAGISRLMQAYEDRASSAAERASIRAEREAFLGGLSIETNEDGQFTLALDQDAQDRIDAIADSRVGGSWTPELASLRQVISAEEQGSIGLETGTNALGELVVNGIAGSTHAVTDADAPGGPAIVLDAERTHSSAEAAIHEPVLHIARLWGGGLWQHPDVDAQAAWLREAISGQRSSPSYGESEGPGGLVPRGGEVGKVSVDW